MKKKQLFVTTGLISIINAMAVIGNDKSHDNTLYIAARVRTEDFIKLNRDIILPGFFKEVFYDENREKYETKEYLQQFETVYLTPQPGWNFHLNHDNIILIEEGISSYCHFPPSATNGVKGAILRNYLDSIFYIKSDFKVYKENKENLRKILKKIAGKYKGIFEPYRRNNQILMMSQYIYSRIFPEEKVCNFYKKHIDTLLDLGYSIIFKNHPRINENTFDSLKTRYGNQIIFLPNHINIPCEIMALYFNFVMSVSSMSGAGISLADLFGIPAFGFGANIIGEYPLNSYVNFYKRFYLNYIPHISAIYDIPASLPDKNAILKKRFYDFVNAAPDWRNDEKILNAHRKYIGNI